MDMYSMLFIWSSQQDIMSQSAGDDQKVLQTLKSPKLYHNA